jgi:uncharacterized membrane protein YeaQ/YmgE (transglycosylase-associated protein family)
MDILLMIATSVITGIIATLVARRDGIGWWIGDQISALFGAGVATYMVNTIHMGKAINYYLLWIVVGAAAGAMASLAFSNMLLGREEEEAEPAVEGPLEPQHSYEEFEPVHEAPLQRAA